MYPLQENQHRTVITANPLTIPIRVSPYQHSSPHFLSTRIHSRPSRSTPNKPTTSHNSPRRYRSTTMVSPSASSEDIQSPSLSSLVSQWPRLLTTHHQPNPPFIRAFEATTYLDSLAELCRHMRIRRIDQPDLIRLVEADREEIPLNRWTGSEDQGVHVPPFLGEVGGGDEVPSERG